VWASSGTLASGTFALNATTPLEGDNDFKYTQGAGSLDEWILSDAKTISPGYRGKTVGINVVFSHNGSATDFGFGVYDATNSTILVEPANNLLTSSSGNFQVTFTIPATCASLKVGFHTKALNSGKILYFDIFKHSSTRLKT